MGVTLAAPGRLEAWRRDHPDGTSVRGDYVALWNSTAPEDPAAWLGSVGWQADLFDLAERSSAYGRPLDESAQRTHRTAGLVEATRL
jgi:hypothetical protein